MNNIMNIIKKNKKKFYIILVVIILIIIMGIYNIINKSNNKKEVVNENYVYTQVENGNNKLPYINIKSDKIDNINNNISDKYFDTITDTRNSFKYEYYIEDNILYLFINIEKYINDIKNQQYIGYYININNNKIYNIEEILKMHELNYNTVETNIINKINTAYYEDQYVEKGFCDFDCYLDIHDVSNIKNNLVLYYNGNSLKGYLNYNPETVYYVEENTLEFPHEFKL